MTGDATGDPEPSLQNVVQSMVLVCADGDALRWKEIWMRWTYSETVMCATQLAIARQRVDAELADIKDPLTAFMAMLFRRIR